MKYLIFILEIGVSMKKLNLNHKNLVDLMNNFERELHQHDAFTREQEKALKGAVGNAIGNIILQAVEVED